MGGHALSSSNLRHSPCRHLFSLPHPLVVQLLRHAHGLGPALPAHAQPVAVAPPQGPEHPLAKAAAGELLLVVAVDLHLAVGGDARGVSARKLHDGMREEAEKEKRAREGVRKRERKAERICEEPSSSAASFRFDFCTRKNVFFKTPLSHHFLSRSKTLFCFSHLSPPTRCWAAWPSARDAKELLLPLLRLLGAGPLLQRARSFSNLRRR